MSYTFDEIRQLVVAMQADQGPLIRKMRDILQRYDGDWVLPVPEVENEPRLPQLTPALIGEAVDQIALRAASVAPSIMSPAISAGKERGVRSREYGKIRASAISATYERSRWKLGRRRYYRHLTAYHTASLIVRPDMKEQMPVIEVRDPLASYVEPKAAESLSDPCYAAFVTRLSGAKLRERWPQLRAENRGPITARDSHRLWEVVEWYDEDHVVWGLLGTDDASYGLHVNTSDFPAGRISMEIDRLPNRAGRPPVVVPHNVSLGRIASRIGSMLGNVDLQAKLMALQIIAQEKAIFPDVYVIGSNSADPQLVGGEWRDGRTGDVNLVRDAQQIGVLRQTPDPTTGTMIDRLERNFRTSTSLVPQLGGETYGALRTGRGIDALAGMALDPRIQELHEITEAYLPALNKAIIHTYKGYWGSKSYSLYTGRANERRLVEFVPNEHFETDETAVSYFVAGADVLQLTQVLGSLLGTKTISRRTFQDNHPMIGDAEGEAAQIREEELEEAAMQAVMQQVLSGQMPATVTTMLRDEISNGVDVLTALSNVNRKLQEMQASAAPPAPEGMVAPPQTMPGLTGGPAADQMQMPPQVQVPADVSRMRQLVQTMGG